MEFAFLGVANAKADLRVFKKNLEGVVYMPRAVEIRDSGF
jgi:hypothetical protein